MTTELTTSEVANVIGVSSVNFAKRVAVCDFIKRNREGNTRFRASAEKWLEFFEEQCPWLDEIVQSGESRTFTMSEIVEITGINDKTLRNWFPSNGIRNARFLKQFVLSTLRAQSKCSELEKFRFYKQNLGAASSGDGDRLLLQDHLVPSDFLPETPVIQRKQQLPKQIYLVGIQRPISMRADLVDCGYQADSIIITHYLPAEIDEASSVFVLRFDGKNAEQVRLQIQVLSHAGVWPARIILIMPSGQNLGPEQQLATQLYDPLDAWILNKIKEVLV